MAVARLLGKVKVENVSPQSEDVRDADQHLEETGRWTVIAEREGGCNASVLKGAWGGGDRAVS